MKLLFLSPCGRTKQAEDVAYINLYLASLKKHVVPHYDVKVILFNNALNQNSSESLTWQRVKEFGLEHVVEVKNMYEMGLPPKSLEFLENMHWVSKIGINMNMLFDYSKNNDFFGADWIFHFDTDLEFLPNFQSVFSKIHPITEVNSEVMITVGGDTYPYNIRYQDVEFIFDEPERVYMYDDSTIYPNFALRQLKINRRNKEATDASRYIDNDKLFFNLQQQKIRNDFVGYSKQAANQHTFNWVSCHYPNNYEAVGKLNDNEDAHLLKKLWDEKSSSNFELVVSHDKGSLPQFFLQGSSHNVVKVQLRGYSDMAKHYSSGWFGESSDVRVIVTQSFKECAKQRLTKEYTDTQYIWEKDYLTSEEIENKRLLISHPNGLPSSILGRSTIDI